MIFSFDIPGTLPTLNEYIDTERTNRYAAATLKKTTQEYIKSCIPSDATHFKGSVIISFRWIRPNARNDKDNVAFAKKFILDALQEAEIIEKDSWKLCTPYDIGFAVNKQNPRTIVTIKQDYDEE